MKCQSCGAENADNAAFCAKCGSKIDPAAPNPPAAPASQTQKPSRTAIDFLPNAAEKIAMPIAFGSIAAGLVGTIAGFFDDGLSLVGDIPSTTLELVLLFSLYGGLRRIGSKVSKWCGCLCGVEILAIVLGAILVLCPDQLSEKAAQGLLRFFFWWLLFSVVFSVSVMKRHSGRLKTYAIMQLIISLLSASVAAFDLPDGLVSAIGFGLESLVTILLAKVLSKDRPSDLLKRILSTPVN